MRLSKRECFGLFMFIILPLFILGCASSKDKTPSNTTEEVKLNLGAMLKSENGIYKVCNYEEGKYKETKSNEIILIYDKSSSNYVCVEDKKYYIVTSKNKFQINDSDYSQLKLSSGGKYISYFVEDNGLKLKVFDTDENKQIDIKSNVAISGILYDWYDQENLIYYGIDSDGKNGLFTYNIKENKENLLYNMKEGYLAFLKTNGDNVVFIQLTLENKKQLMVLNKESKEVTLLSKAIDNLTDIKMYNEKMYFTGKASNNINSLYELDNNKIRRLVFDFPAIVNVEKGLEIDDDGNILFIGSENSSNKEEQIYEYSNDGSISSISESSVDYAFVDYKN